MQLASKLLSGLRTPGNLTVLNATQRRRGSVRNSASSHSGVCFRVIFLAIYAGGQPHGLGARAPALAEQRRICCE